MRIERRQVRFLAWTLAALALTPLAHARQAAPPAIPKPVPPPSAADPKVRADDDKSVAGETPIDTPDAADPRDVSATASPVPPRPRGMWIPAGTSLSLRMGQPVNSGTQHNGELVNGSLLEPVRLSNGVVLPAGTAVRTTVLAAAAAGKIQSAGVLSLQVVRVGTVGVISNVLEFAGHQGKAEVADAAPEKGTEAIVQPDAVLKFQVLGAGDTWDASQRGSDTMGGGSSKPNAAQPNVAQPAVSTQNAPQAQSPIHGATQGVAPKP